MMHQPEPWRSDPHDHVPFHPEAARLAADWALNGRRGSIAAIRRLVRDADGTELDHAECRLYVHSLHYFRPPFFAVVPRYGSTERRRLFFTTLGEARRECRDPRAWDILVCPTILDAVDATADSPFPRATWRSRPMTPKQTEDGL